MAIISSPEYQDAPEQPVDIPSQYEVNPDGTIAIPVGPEPEPLAVGPDPMEAFDVNLADYLPESDLTKIASDVIDAYKADKESRGDHEQMLEHGIELLGLKLQESSQPFQGACSAVHPLIIESAVKFEAKAIQELYPASGPVKAEVYGIKTPQKLDKAARVKEFMNFQILDQIPDYYSEDERLLFTLPIMGSAFKKTYWDAETARPATEYIPFDQFHVSYWATTLERAERYTHVIYLSANEIRKRQLLGVYTDTDLGQPSQPEISSLQDKIDNVMGIQPTASQFDEKYTLLEQHVDYLLDDPLGDGEIALPYVITVEETSRKVVSIRRNWDPEDPTKRKLLWFTHYKYVPGFGFYGLGLPHLIGNLTDSATYALRSLSDAGQFATLPAGFKRKGLRIAGDNTPFRPGEWREIDFVGDDIKGQISPLPYKEPSLVLFQLLQFMDQRGTKFADSTEAVIAESTNYGPVGTTLALLEASTRFYASIFKRVHASRGNELKILYRVNSWYLPEEYPYDVADQAGRVIFRADFDGSLDVQPVSDPNVPTMAHRLAKASTLLDIALKTPQVHDMREAVVRVYQAMEVQDINLLVPPPPESFSGDPVSENMMSMMNRPIQASVWQDHQAHIASHMAFAQDPRYGGSEQGRMAAMALQDHIREHMAMDYKRQVEAALGQQIPTGQKLPPQMEIPLSQAEAKAGQAIMAHGQSQTPEQLMAQIEMMRAETDRMDVEQKGEADTAELAVKLRQLDLKELELLVKAASERLQLEGKMAISGQKEDAAFARETVKAAVATAKARSKGK